MTNPLPITQQNKDDDQCSWIELSAATANVVLLLKMRMEIAETSDLSPVRLQAEASAMNGAGRGCMGAEREIMCTQPQKESSR